MDHVINRINVYYEIEIDYLYEEWSSDEYKKLSDCPSYGACKAMNDAIATLEKYAYGKRKTMTVNEVMKWKMEFAK